MLAALDATGSEALRRRQERVRAMRYEDGATYNPFDTWALESVERVVGKKLELVVAGDVEMDGGIGRDNIQRLAAAGVAVAAVVCCSCGVAGDMLQDLKVGTDSGQCLLVGGRLRDGNRRHQLAHGDEGSLVIVLGELELPKSYPFGIHTHRAEKNFAFSRERLRADIFEALIQVKQAAAEANAGAGLLDPELAEAIVAAIEGQGVEVYGPNGEPSTYGTTFASQVLSDIAPASGEPIPTTPASAALSP